MQKPQQQIPIDISKATDIVCDCKNPYWMEVIRLKRLSLIVSPTGREEIINIPVMLCTQCGKEWENV